MTTGAAAPGLVGRAVARPEDERLLRGRGRYVDDLDAPEAVHVAFVRSPHAHARIVSIRSRAQDALLLLTGAELAGRVRPLPVEEIDDPAAAAQGHPVLAVATVRYVGQPVAAVVAETRALAEDLAELVEVEYEPLEPSLDPRSAPETLLRSARASAGVEEAFAAAARVVRGSFSAPRLVAAPIEPRAALASYDPDLDLVTIWVSAQGPYRQLDALAHVLMRPEPGIRVIVPDVGGSFGSKGPLAPETCATAVAAIDLRRPVRWVEDRLENFLAAAQGRGMDADVELALDGEGRFLALRARLVADLGGYLLPSTAGPPRNASTLLTGCYAIPAAEVEVRGARTSKVPTGPYRGAGRPEAALFLERTVDLAARELGADPVELRRLNLVPGGAFPYETPLGLSYDSGDFERLLDRAVELVEPERSAERERVVGTGVGMFVERSGGDWESARVSIAADGRVIVESGASPHGQGHATTLAQIAAGELRIPLDRVELRFGDSAGLRGIGTFGSRSTAMAGSAVLAAIERLKPRCRAVAGGLLDADPDGLSWDERGISAGSRTLTLAELAAAEPGLEAEARFSSPSLFGSGCYAAVVEIERATGRMAVRRLVAVDDAGRIVNPLLAEGQVVGGVAQALGECLVEEVVLGDDGQPRTASFADYPLLTAAEMPPVGSEFLETPSPHNPLGAKGIGESGAIGALAAVSNAVTDALGGRIVDPPFTPEKLWRVLRDAPPPAR